MSPWSATSHTLLIVRRPKWGFYHPYRTYSTDENRGHKSGLLRQPAATANFRKYKSSQLKNCSWGRNRKFHLSTSVCLRPLGERTQRSRGCCSNPHPAGPGAASRNTSRTGALVFCPMCPAPMSGRLLLVSSLPGLIIRNLIVPSSAVSTTAIPSL